MCNNLGSDVIKLWSHCPNSTAICKLHLSGQSIIWFLLIRATVKSRTWVVNIPCLYNHWRCDHIRAPPSTVTRGLVRSGRHLWCTAGGLTCWGWFLGFWRKKHSLKEQFSYPANRLSNQINEWKALWITKMLLWHASLSCSWQKYMYITIYTFFSFAKSLRGCQYMSMSDH